MISWRRIGRYLLALACFGAVFWIYKIDSRRRQVYRFFSRRDDLEWARPLIDKKFNFCDAPLVNSISRIDGEQKTYLSPSMRFQPRPANSIVPPDEDPRIALVDQHSGNNGVVVEIDGYLSSDTDFKWTRDERFLVHTSAITKDDWLPARIFITDTSSGRSIYLGDSAFYECELRHW
ncbi:hypothetical protein EBZ80_14125 [bacterium]|nr:hypothetical protein [bacterium]